MKRLILFLILTIGRGTSKLKELQLNPIVVKPSPIVVKPNFSNNNIYRAPINPIDTTKQ